MQGHSYRPTIGGATNNSKTGARPRPSDWDDAREVRIRELARQLGELIRRVDLLTKQRDEAFRQLLEERAKRGAP